MASKLLDVINNMENFSLKLMIDLKILLVKNFDESATKFCLKSPQLRNRFLLKNAGKN
jgi:hypothetical protein